MSLSSWSSRQCDSNALSAYLDGELAPAARAAIEEHLVACAKCRDELAELRELSVAFSRYPYADLTPAERQKVHQAIDAAVDAPILRIGGLMGLIAASILVVSSAWLVAIPPASNSASGRATPGGATVASSAPTPAEWERIAATLRVDVPQAMDDQVYLAEANLDEFMLNALKQPVGGGGGAQP